MGLGAISNPAIHRTAYGHALCFPFFAFFCTLAGQNAAWHASLVTHTVSW